MCVLLRAFDLKNAVTARSGGHSPQPKRRPAAAAIDRMVGRVSVSDTRHETELTGVAMARFPALGSSALALAAPARADDAGTSNDCHPV